MANFSFQEPVVFSGSIRENLDPYGQHTESDIWESLENSYLKDYISGLGLGLDLECGEDGSNMRWYISHNMKTLYDDVIKWKHFPHYWPFVRGIHRRPVNSPHKGQWRGTLMFSLMCVWINDWVNNREAGDLRRCRAHYDVSVMNSLRYTGPLINSYRITP